DGLARRRRVDGPVQLAEHGVDLDALQAAQVLVVGVRGLRRGLGLGLGEHRRGRRGQNESRRSERSHQGWEDTSEGGDYAAFAGSSTGAGSSSAACSFRWSLAIST